MSSGHETCVNENRRFREGVIVESVFTHLYPQVRGHIKNKIVNLNRAICQHTIVRLKPTNVVNSRPAHGTKKIAKNDQNGRSPHFFFTVVPLRRIHIRLNSYQGI